MLDISKTLFIVDGLTEIYSFRAKLSKDFHICPEFRKAPSNGEDVTAQGYVNGIIGILKPALCGKYTNIICILDKEKRKVSALKFSKKIKDEIIFRMKDKFNEQELVNKISVIVSDICFENWIVADVEGIKNNGLIKENIIQEYYDGKSGVSVLKTFMNVSYQKTIHAPILFKQVSLDRAKTYSPSIQVLHELIS